MIIFNALYNFALYPATTINKIMDERRLGLALLGYFAGAASTVMVIGLNQGGLSRAWFMLGLPAFMFFNLCVGFFFSSSAHLFLELATGKGRAAGLFVLIGLSEFTKTILVAFAIISLAMPWIAGAGALVSLLVFILQIFVILFMMHHAYGLSKTGTFFALVASVIPSVISMFALGFLFIWFLVRTFLL